MQKIHQLLEARAAHTPEAVFLFEPAGTTTYAALQSMVDAATRDLLAAGVRPTDRVVLVAENCAAHIALLMACSRVGAWSCGVNARMSPGEIAAIAERADARLCYFTTGASEAACQHAGRARCGRLPRCRRRHALRRARAKRATEARRGVGRHGRHHLHLRHLGHAQGRDGVAPRPAAFWPRLGPGAGARARATASTPSCR